MKAIAPAPAAHSMENKIARHFKDTVPDKEYPGSKPEHIGGKPQVARHLRGGKADRDSIDECGDIQQR
jgi:hypothetical protein